MGIRCIHTFTVNEVCRLRNAEIVRHEAAVWPHKTEMAPMVFFAREGINDIARVLIAFDSLTSYETYQARLRSDPEGRRNFAAARTRRFILREERDFVEVVDGVPDSICNGFGHRAFDCPSRLRTDEFAIMARER